MESKKQTGGERNANAGLMKSATYAAVAVASSLVMLKFAAWIFLKLFHEDNQPGGEIAENIGIT